MDTEPTPIQKLFKTLGLAGRRCNGPTCEATIYFLTTAKGKLMPVDEDGTPHWATCPDAKRFGKGAREQEQE